MKKTLSRAVAIAGLGLLAACQTSGGVQRGTQVTRFHLNQQIPVQAIAIEPGESSDAGSLEFRTYADIVAEQLSRIGFARSVDIAASEMVAVVDVERATRATPPRGSPISIGIGGGSFGRNLGVGLGTSVGVGGSRGGDVEVTQLWVALKRRSEGTTVWEGRAIRESLPGAEDPAAIVRRLAESLFQDFPGESGTTITVE